MINQLEGSSAQERRDKQSSIYVQALSNQFQDSNTYDHAYHERQHTQQIFLPQLRLFQRPLKIIRPDFTREKQLNRRLGQKFIDQIRYRLQQKQIWMPKPSLSAQSNYALIKPRAKTEANQLFSRENEQNQDFQRTINEIQRINQHNRCGNKEQFVRIQPLFINYSTDRTDSRLRPVGRFQHLNRQNDFYRYIDHLQKMHSFGFIDRQVPQLSFSLSQVHRRQPKTTIPILQPKRTNNLERTYKKDSQTRPVNFQTNKNQDVIKILKKAKNRGQSLLSKLTAFQSSRVLHK